MIRRAGGSPIDFRDELLHLMRGVSFHLFVQLPSKHVCIRKYVSVRPSILNMYPTKPMCSVGQRVHGRHFKMMRDGVSWRGVSLGLLRSIIVQIRSVYLAWDDIPRRPEYHVRTGDALPTRTHLFKISKNFENNSMVVSPSA
jgi:hypothetical protein